MSRYAVCGNVNDNRMGDFIARLLLHRSNVGAADQPASRPINAAVRRREVTSLTPSCIMEPGEKPGASRPFDRNDYVLRARDTCQAERLSHMKGSRKLASVFTSLIWLSTPDGIVA